MASRALVLFLLLLPLSAANAQTSAPGATGAGGGPAIQPADSSEVATGDVVADNGEPVPYATVMIEPGNHARFADAGGSFSIGHLTARIYRLRVRQIGFAEKDTLIQLGAVPEAGGGAPGEKRLRVTLRRIAVKLPPVNIVEARECLVPGIPDSTISQSLAALFGELLKNVERYRLLVEEYPFAYTREEWRVYRNDAGYEQTVSLDTVAYDVRAMKDRRYKPGSVTYTELQRGDVRQMMYLPTFGDLGDSLFQKTHCFEYAGEDTTAGARGTGGTPLIRVDFGPATSIKTPDVEGSVYLDELRYIVRRAEFRLTRPNKASPPIVGVRAATTFREILPLVPLFDEVHYFVPDYPGGSSGKVEIDRLLAFRFYQTVPGAGQARQAIIQGY
jgi:hypothetical protein